MCFSIPFVTVIFFLFQNYSGYWNYWMVSPTPTHCQTDTDVRPKIAKPRNPPKYTWLFVRFWKSVELHRTEANSSWLLDCRWVETSWACFLVNLDYFIFFQINKKKKYMHLTRGSIPYLIKNVLLFMNW